MVVHQHSSALFLWADHFRCFELPWAHADLQSDQFKELCLPYSDKLGVCILNVQYSVYSPRFCWCMPAFSQCSWPTFGCGTRGSWSFQSPAGKVIWRCFPWPHGPTNMDKKWTHNDVYKPITFGLTDTLFYKQEVGFVLFISTVGASR